MLHGLGLQDTFLKLQKDEYFDFKNYRSLTGSPFHGIFSFRRSLQMRIKPYQRNDQTL